MQILAKGRSSDFVHHSFNFLYYTHLYVHKFIILMFYMNAGSVKFCSPTLSTKKIFISKESPLLYVQ